MRLDSPGSIRNIGVAAHIDAGRTTTIRQLVEHLGYDRADDLDVGSGEYVSGLWNNARINIVNTPGHVDFVKEVRRSLRVIDGCLFIFCGEEGVQPQSAKVWQLADERRVPRVVFVNKLDLPGVDGANVLRQMRIQLGAKAYAIEMPWREGDELKGIIDLVTLKAYRHDASRSAQALSEVTCPPGLKETAQGWQQELLAELLKRGARPQATESADTLLQDEQALRSRIRQATLEERFVPVLFGSALSGIGIPRVLDALCEYLPSPEAPTGSVAALLFKKSADATFGVLNHLRVFTGSLPTGQSVFNPRTRQRVEIKKLIRRSKEVEALTELKAGDIGTCIGLRDARVGDTLCDEAHPVVLELPDKDSA